MPGQRVKNANHGLYYNTTDRNPIKAGFKKLDLHQKSYRDPEFDETCRSFDENMALLKETIQRYQESQYFKDFKAWQAEWFRVNGEDSRGEGL